jgi:hypothetical protein
VIAVTHPRIAMGRESGQSEVRLTIALQASRPGWRSAQALWQGLCALDAEAQLVAICLAACLLVLFTVPIGSNMAYFSGVVFFLAVAVLPTTLLRATQVSLSSARVLQLIVLATSLLAIVCTYRFAVMAGQTITTLYQAALSDRPKGVETIRALPGPVSLVNDSIRSTGTVLGLLRRQMATLPWTLLTRDLVEKSAASGPMVVHVRASADEVWKRLQGRSPYWCIAAHMMIPAETGLVEIRSIEPKALETECVPPGVLYYGFGRDQDLHRTGAFTKQQLCAAAQSVAAERIYMLESITQPVQNELWDCTSETPDPKGSVEAVGAVRAR